MQENQGKSDKKPEEEPEETRDAAGRERLLGRIRERDRRLAELTDQALGLLDKLEEARRDHDEELRLRQRIAKLEGLLAVARQEVRRSAATVLHGPVGEPESQLAVCCWPRPDSPLTAEYLEGLLEDFEEASVVAVGPPKLIPEHPPVDPRLQVVQLESCRTPAQCWNAGMAVTDAPVVLFLVHGTRWQTQGDTWQVLDDHAVAFGQPLLAGTATGLGLAWGNDPYSIRRPDAGGRPEMQKVLSLDLAAPEAFALRRDAYHQVGPFDQDLLGTMALTDYSLRVVQATFKIAGLPSAIAQTDIDLLAGDEHLTRDRMIVLARWSPRDLGAELGRTGVLWDLLEPERKSYLDKLWSRLPEAAQWPEALQVLADLALGLVACSASDRDVDGHLRVLAESIGADLPPARTDRERLQAAADRVEAAIRALEQRCRDLEARLERQQDALQRESARRAEVEAGKEGLRAALEADKEGLRVELAKVFTSRDCLAARSRALDLAVEAIGADPESLRARLAALESDLEASWGSEVSVAATFERLLALRSELHERNQWICRLLLELGRRRINLLRRPLQEHERQFLDHMGQRP